MGSALVQELRNFVDGVYMTGQGDLFADVSPVDGSIVATVHEAGAETVDTAVHAARKALDGSWGEIQLRDIVVDLPPVFESFYQSRTARTCEQCGTVHPGKG